MHRRNSDKQIITGTAAELTSDTTIYPVNFELSPTDTADAGKHKLCDDIHTYAQLPFIEDGGGVGTTYTATAPIVVTGTVISSENSTGGNAATDAGKLVKFDTDGGVKGSSATDIGVEGIASGTASAGVKGSGNGIIPGLYGQSINGPAMFGVSTGTGIGGQVVQSNLGNSANLFEYHNSDGLRSHVSNAGVYVIADAAAIAAQRAALGLPNVFEATVTGTTIDGGAINQFPGVTFTVANPSPGTFRVDAAGGTPFTAGKTFARFEEVAEEGATVGYMSSWFLGSDDRISFGFVDDAGAPADPATFSITVKVYP